MLIHGGIPFVAAHLLAPDPSAPSFPLAADGLGPVGSGEINQVSGEDHDRVRRSSG